MSIGAAIYSYRNNFNCKKTKPSFGKTTKIKPFNLIIDGFRFSSKYDDDYFIGIAQYLMKKGYPKKLFLNDKMDNLNEFFMKALFSVCPFHFQSLMINYNKFNVFEWRKQFDLHSEIKITGLNFYRNRGSMPLEDFTSLRDIYKIIFTKYGKYNEINEQLNFSFNSSHPKAIWIISKFCIIHKNYFEYKISYGYEEDLRNSENKISHSSWNVSVRSKENENYVDFCLRIYNNYEAIISGDKKVLISCSYQNDEKNFYLGGNFKLNDVSF